MTDNDDASQQGLFTLPGSVWYVYLHVFTTVVANACTNPVLVLYLNVQGWTSASDVTFYTVVVFSGTVIPLLLSPAFGLWQERRPTAELFAVDAVVSGYGYLMMAVASHKWLFFAGYCLSRCSQAQKATRTTYVIRTTSNEQRSQAVGLLPVFALLGGLIGPLLALALSSVPTLQVRDIAFSQYTLCFWISSLLGFVRLPMMLVGFTEERFNDTSEEEEEDDDDESSLLINDGDDSKNKSSDDEEAHGWRWLGYFSVWTLLSSTSFGIYYLTLQPVCANVYHFAQREMSALMFAMSVITIAPGLLMGVLSRKFKVQDRWFLLVGALGMAVALLVYALPPGDLGLLITGALLMLPFYTLQAPTTYTLFSKIVGDRHASGVKNGLLSSASLVGAAVGALIGGPVALPLYGSAEFLLFLVPLLCCLPLVLLSWSALLPSLP